MRLVIKNLADKPAILSKQTTLDALDELVKAANPSSIRETLYQDAYTDEEGKRQMRVRDKLNEYYRNKCAYCETFCKAEIEHYRPKKGVTEDKMHPGYYWLCYEWSNLIPSCHDCNTSGGKGNKFPVQGTRVTTPPLNPAGKLDLARVISNQPPLIGEEPCLLHPEIDKPGTFLGFQLDSIGEGLQLYGLDGINQRGQQTINICNLNRKSLKLSRLKTLTGFITGINIVFGLLAGTQLAPENLESALQLQFSQMDDNASNPDLEHTLLRRFAIESTIQFSALVLPLLEPMQQPIVLAAFVKYREMNPASPN